MTPLRSWFSNTRVQNKIFLGYGVVLLFMILIAVLVLIQSRHVEAVSRESRTASEIELEATRLDAAFTARTAAFLDYLLAGQQDALDDYQEATEQFGSSLSELRRLVQTRERELARADAEQRRRLQRVEQIESRWTSEVVEPEIALRQTVRAEGGLGMDTVVSTVQAGGGRRAAARMAAQLDSLREVQADIAAERGESRDEALRDLRQVTILFTALAALLSFLAAMWLARRIAGPLEEAVEFAGGVAGGDLTRQLDIDSSDEVGEMIGTLNRMASDLRGTLGGVGAATNQVASAAEEIAAAAEQISYTADQQVRSTEETSSSMEQIAAQIARVSRSTESLAASVDQTSSSIGEMSNAIEQTAASAEALGSSVEQTSATIEEMAASMTQVGRHVDETRQIARAAEADARAGGEAVERTTDGMRRIHGEIDGLVQVMRQLGSTSEAIGRVSEVMENIADQTNLLALNASIEAARAGEHGRGFAVVAGEIRRLAERSVESSREIGTTIRGVVDDVHQAVRSTGEVADRTGEGIRLADSAGDALEKIIGSAGRTRTLMDEVALATQQQIEAAGQTQDSIQHILRVTGEMRIATREQATGTRQIVDAVENMNRQTREVFAATEEQKRGGEMILQSTESINEGARTTQGAIQEMASSARDLSSEAKRLSELVGTFRV